MSVFGLLRICWGRSTVGWPRVLPVSKGLPVDRVSYSSRPHESFLPLTLKRASNPDGLDRNKYFKDVCTSLYRRHPTRYTFLAGLDSSRSRDELQITEGKVGLRFETEQSENLPDKVRGDQGGGWFTDSTEDYIRRSIVVSNEEQVKTHRAEMLELLEVLVEPDGAAEEGKVLEENCLRLFDAWVGDCKFGVGYLFFLTRADEEPDVLASRGDEFISRIVRQLAPMVDELSAERLVALMLMICLRKRPWSAEELFDFLDPTLLQKRLAYLIRNEGLSEAEICAVCIGFKRSTNIAVNVAELRDALYGSLMALSETLSKCESNPAIGAAIVNKAVIQLCTLLHQGVHFAKDLSENIVNVQKSFISSAKLHAQDHATVSDHTGGFLLSIRAAIKLMTFGSARGGFHDQEWTPLVFDRLMIGREVTSLSLRDLCSLLKFLAQMKDFGTGSDVLPVSELATSIRNELATIHDAGCTLRDVLDMLQSYLYLAAFDEFERSRFDVLFSQINGLHENLFQPSSDCSLDAQNEELGKHLAERCFMALFPKSFGAMSFEDHCVRSRFGRQDFKQFSRLLASLDRTISLYTKSERLLKKSILARLIQLNQAPLPAVVYDVKSKLPTVALTRRQRLLHMVHRGLVLALGNENYVKIVYLLPHFKEPDIVFGHFSGIKLTVPQQLLDSSPYEMKPAPDIGDWFVIAVDSPSFRELDLGDLKKTGDYSQTHAEPERQRQLMKLGYQVYNLSALEQRKLLHGHCVKWAHKVLANILTGLPQSDPSTKKSDI